MKTEQKDCEHNELVFGNRGDYYLSCQQCGISWVRSLKKTEQPDDIAAANSQMSEPRRIALTLENATKKGFAKHLSAEWVRKNITHPIDVEYDWDYETNDYAKPKKVDAEATKEYPNQDNLDVKD